MTTHTTTTTTPSRLRRLALPFVGAIALTVALIAPVSPASAAGAVPKGSPYLLYTASISANGTGTGYSSYINVHDAHNNAYSFGIQSDKGSPQSKGKPRYIWERVQNGKFTYGYLGLATNKLTPHRHALVQERRRDDDREPQDDRHPQAQPRRSPVLQRRGQRPPER
ncbi:hypothetical protein WDV91_05435 [Curtobacterium flaccumfaciens pv. flaccumfaciens]